MSDLSRARGMLFALDVVFADECKSRPLDEAREMMVDFEHDRDQANITESEEDPCACPGCPSLATTQCSVCDARLCDDCPCPEGLGEVRMPHTHARNGEL